MRALLLRTGDDGHGVGVVSHGNAVDPAHDVASVQAGTARSVRRIGSEDGDHARASVLDRHAEWMEGD